MARTSEVTPARRRVIELLKRRAGRTPAELASELGLTVAAVRLHLQALAEHGLAESSTRPTGGRGRPVAVWSLTPLADSFFPDRHADLTVSLIESLRESLGDEGLDRVISERERKQVDAYREEVGGGSLRRRVERLAQLRTEEGYMAEVEPGDDGSIVLVENHCPICEAASTCKALCRSELDVFRAVLGDDVIVEREQHLVSGDDRCVYRIRRTGSGDQTSTQSTRSGHQNVPGSGPVTARIGSGDQTSTQSTRSCHQNVPGSGPVTARIGSGDQTST